MITTLSSKGIGVMNVGSVNNSKKKEKDTKVDDGFSSIMQIISNKNEPDNISKSDKDYANSTSNDNITDTRNDGYDIYKSKDNHQNKYDSTSENLVDNKLDTVSVVDEDQVTDVIGEMLEIGIGSEEVYLNIEGVTDSQVDSTLMETETDEIIMEDASNLLDVICKQLNIDLDEANSVLEKLGLKVNDLLELNNAKEFITSIKGVTESAFLTDESLSDLLGQVTEFIDKYNTEIATDSSLNKENANLFSENVEVVKASAEIIKSDSNIEKVPNGKVFDTSNSMINEKDINPQNSNDNSNNGNDSNSSHQEFGRNVLNNINIAINNTVNNMQNNNFVNDISQADIIRQVIDSIKVSTSKELSSIEINLNPESLGKVNVSVVSKNGVMTANIIAETEAAKTAIEASLNVLKETFNNQDIKVEAIEVMLGTSDMFNNNDEKEEFQQQSNNNKQMSLNGLDPDVVSDELTKEEVIQMEMMRMEGRSISYMA